MKHRWTIYVVAIAAIGISLGLAGQAVAGKDGHRGCGRNHVPGGNSQVGQYTEPGTLPGSCGNQTIDRSDGGPSNSVPASTSSQLQSYGPAGVATEQLASATSPPGSNGAAGGASGGGSAGAGANNGSHGGGGAGGSVGGASLPNQVGTVLTSGDIGGGMGIALPLIIGATAVAGVAYVLYRYRRRSSL